jgi:peptidoglycan/xylan/chitin deacetylase (PgdA/CDA1 family)
MEGAKRWIAAQLWRAAGRAAKDRELLYGGATGLRVLTFHETLPDQMEQLKRIVDFCRSRFRMASPADADGIFAGRWPDGGDRVLLTFDDGYGSNFAAAQWLASIGVSATFFVVPPLIDRTTDEYLRFHERFGVKAYIPLARPGARGLASSQLREMAAMGHRIGAHNFAHRDLGQLHDPAAIRYEIANATEMVGERTGVPCSDFAIAFGQPENVSDEAAAYLLEHCLRVYSCHRGLNVPGRTPKFLLRHAWEPEHPFAFTRICIEGGADRRVAEGARAMARRVGVLPRG